MFEQLPFATIDHLRPITQGHQEVIFCPDKTIGQVLAIAERFADVLLHVSAFFALCATVVVFAARVFVFDHCVANDHGDVGWKG